MQSKIYRQFRSSPMNYVFCGIIFLHLASIISLGFSFSKHQIWNTQLCPDPVMQTVQFGDTFSNQSMLIRILGNKASKSHRTAGLTPCSIVTVPAEIDGQMSKISFSKIRVSEKSWDFSSTLECPHLLKFENKFEVRQTVDTKWCSVVERHQWPDGAYQNSPIVVSIHTFDMHIKRILSFHFSYFPSHHTMRYLQLHFIIQAGETTTCQIQQYSLYSYDDEQNPRLCVETDDEHLRRTICGVYDCQNLSRANGHLLNATKLYVHEDDDDSEINFYTNERILTLVKFILAAALPLMLSALIVAVYRQFIFPRMLRSHHRALRRRAANRCDDDGSCPQSSVELRETWHFSDQHSGISMHEYSLGSNGLPNAALISIEKDMPPAYEDELCPPSYEEATGTSATKE